MPPDEVVLYLVFRSDLDLPKGKLAAQAGHAVQLVLRAVERYGTPDALRFLAEWEGASYTKIALKVKDGDELAALHARLAAAGVVVACVVDEGRTVIAAGTTTALGLQPLPRSVAREYVGDLRLL